MARRSPPGGAPPPSSLRRLQHLVQGERRQPAAQARDAQLVEEAPGPARRPRAPRAGAAVDRRRGRSRRETDQRAGVERPQAETFISSARRASGYAVSSTWKPRSSRKPSTSSVRRRPPGASLSRAPGRPAAAAKLAGAAQTGQSGADDDDVAHAPCRRRPGGPRGLRCAPGGRAPSSPRAGLRSSPVKCRRKRRRTPARWVARASLNFVRRGR